MENLYNMFSYLKTQKHLKCCTFLPQVNVYIILVSEKQIAIHGGCESLSFCCFNAEEPEHGSDKENI